MIVKHHAVSFLRHIIKYFRHRHTHICKCAYSHKPTQNITRYPMVNEQVMITLCSAVGCGIAIVVLSLLVTLSRKIAAHHKHKAESKKEAKAEALKEKEDDKKAESADADEAKRGEKAEDSKPSNSGKKDEKADDKKDESNDSEKSDK